MLTCQKWRAGRALWLRLSWLERKLRRGCTDLDCTFGRWCSGWLLLQELNQSPLGLPARCGESGVNLEQRVIRFFFVKNKITLRSMQLYLVPPSYGRSGAQGWYSTGWKIKLLLACYFCYQLTSSVYQFSQTPSTSLSSFAMKTFPFLSDSDVDEKLSYLQLWLLFETRSSFKMLPASYYINMNRNLHLIA